MGENKKHTKNNNKIKIRRHSVADAVKVNTKIR